MTFPRLILKNSLFSCALLPLIFSLNTNAETETMETIDIPVVENAQIFAQFNDKNPAVINYFTKESEASVMAFYQSNYGEPVKQERKYGRLTLNYSTAGQKIRVAITEQSKMRQVDIIVENAQ